MGNFLEAANRQRNLELAQHLLAGIGNGHSADEIASLFASDVSFEFPGQAGVLPWVGRRTGRQAIAEFITDTRDLIEALKFDVVEILTSDERAVIVGELASRFWSTGKVVESPFAIILATAGGEITSFQMLEDSFAVSQAAGAS